MKVERQNTKLKRGTCVTLALLIVMTAITTMACMPGVAAIEQTTPEETQIEQKGITTDEGYNYILAKDFKVNEDGSITLDTSDLDLKEGLNLISFSDPMSGEDLNIKFRDADDEDVIDPEFSYTPSEN